MVMEDQSPDADVNTTVTLVLLGINGGRDLWVWSEELEGKMMFIPSIEGREWIYLCMFYGDTWHPSEQPHLLADMPEDMVHFNLLSVYNASDGEVQIEQYHEAIADCPSEVQRFITKGVEELEELGEAETVTEDVAT